MAVVALAGCDQESSENKAKGTARAASVPAVGVVTVAPQQVTLISELPGRTAPYRVAEVRPQVGGVILKRLFTEGSEVKLGQQLYQIDPAPYQATYDNARASLARAEAKLKSAHLLAERYKSLVAVNAVSKQDYDNALAADRQAKADVAIGSAAVETAHINLVYTKVLSPISGRVGRSSVTEGALVTTDQATALATVQQLDPIYVDVIQSSAEMLRLRRELSDGRLQTVGASQALLHLILEDGREYSECGRLLFSEVVVDSSTGTVTLRSVFPNPMHRLLPGMFVHARLQEGVWEQAILVPTEGVTRNQRGEPTALVVGDGDVVQLRFLEVDRAVGSQWLVGKGLDPGDRIVVEGVQRAEPGTHVRIVSNGQTTDQ